ncbi:MAG: hypothetical protein KDD47_08620 [Acidobacteria bacterium]|nr:hypothetical protein [Acidobacteriota bacterium]
MAKILRLAAHRENLGRAQIGRVHPDGSITFRGRQYATIKDLPGECQGLRPDVQTHCQWRALFRPIDPRRK